MTESVRKLIIWLPRILGIIFGLFISLFALDAFDTTKPVIEQILGFLIHMIPGFVIAAVLVISWKWRHGGYLFIALGVLFTVWFHAWENPLSVVTLGGIPVMVGVLFLLSHRLTDPAD